MSLAPLSGAASAVIGGPVLTTPIAPIAPITAGAGQPPPATPVGADAALAQMVADAATAQDGLAPLLAELPTAATAAAGLPDDARAAAAQLLAAQAPLGEDATAADLRAAARTSGVFLEALLAETLDQPDAAAQVVGTDLKALLLKLTAALQPSGPGATPVPARPGAAPPPPPVPGGQLAGQAAAQARIGADTPPEVAAQALARQAGAALARVQLSQAASLEPSDGSAHWSFEATVATPAGPGVAQFEISRDAPRPAKDDAPAPTWRARFSIDAAPGGPVHAELAMSGGRLRVVLTAADETTQQALAAGEADLAGELASAEHADVAVRFAAGAPAARTPSAGRLVDRRS